MEFFLNNPALATYLFLKLNSVVAMLIVLMVLSAIGSLALCIWYAYETDLYNQKHKPEIVAYAKQVFPKRIKIALSALLCFGMLTVMFPTKEDVAVMIGVSAGVGVYKNVAESPITQKAYQVLLSYAEAELDKIIDVKREKKGNK